jgi:hypothetical protein
VLARLGGSRTRERPAALRRTGTVERTAALELRGIKAAYGRIEVVRGIDLVVPQGKVVAILGPTAKKVDDPEGRADCSRRRPATCSSPVGA